MPLGITIVFPDDDYIMDLYEDVHALTKPRPNKGTNQPGRRPRQEAKKTGDKYYCGPR